jgi:hypothetical protein
MDLWKIRKIPKKHIQKGFSPLEILEKNDVLTRRWVGVGKILSCYSSNFTVEIGCGVWREWVWGIGLY